MLFVSKKGKITNHVGIYLMAQAVFRMEKILTSQNLKSSQTCEKYPEMPKKKKKKSKSEQKVLSKNFKKVRNFLWKWKLLKIAWAAQKSCFQLGGGGQGQTNTTEQSSMESHALRDRQIPR